MVRYRFPDDHRFQRLPLALDFCGGVALGGFEIVVQGGQPRVLVRIWVANFLAEHEGPAGAQRGEKAR